MKKINKKYINIIIFILYLLFILFSLIFSYNPGKDIAINFTNFSIDMLKIVPCAFILIGLFEVWVKKETIEKHLGESSGFKGYMWAIILSSTTIGGIYMALPIAHSLYKKGAKLSVVLTYIGASTLTRIPMTIFEASFLGIKFSIIRLVTAIPLVIFSSIIIAKYYKTKNIPTN